MTLSLEEFTAFAQALRARLTGITVVLPEFRRALRDSVLWRKTYGADTPRG